MIASAWEEIAPEDDERFWRTFDDHFQFQPRFMPPHRTAIVEPTPSVTIDLSPVFTEPGPTFAAGQNAVSALALLAMTQVFPATERLLVLDWQHPSWWFRPHQHAIADNTSWPVEVWPDGEYYAFLTEDMIEGTFGHPWEQTLGIFGPRLMPKFMPLLTSWLPIKRSRP